jgi:hypothetical protein
MLSPKENEKNSTLDAPAALHPTYAWKIAALLISSLGMQRGLLTALIDLLQVTCENHRSINHFYYRRLH